MLYKILLVLLVIDSVVLIAAVLMQAGQGGGMAASFGGMSSSTSSIFGARQAGNLLTKASWWCGGIFLGLAFILTLMSTQARGPQGSVFDKVFPEGGGQQTAPPANTVPPLKTSPTPDTGK
jgi:preprotein translocase subunit SecG